MILFNRINALIQPLVVSALVLVFLTGFYSKQEDSSPREEPYSKTLSPLNIEKHDTSIDFSGPGGVSNSEVDIKSGQIDLNISVASISKSESLSLSYNSNTLDYSQVWNDSIQSSEAGFGWMLAGAHQKSFKRISLGSGDEKIHRFMFDTELLKEIEGKEGARIFQLEQSHSLNKFYFYDLKDKPSYWVNFDTKGNKLYYGGDPVKPIDVKSEQNSAVKQACSILTHSENKAISNCYSGSTEHGIKWGSWTGAISSLKYQGHNQEQLATAWNLSSVEDKWGNKTQYKYIQQMQNIGEDKEAKQFSIASFLYEISTPDKQSMQIWYCSRTKSMLSSNNSQSWGSNLCNNIKGARFADYIDPWTQNIEPDSYQEKYSMLYLGGIGTFFNGDNERTIHSLAEPYYKYDAPGDDAGISKLMLTGLSLYKVDSDFDRSKKQPDYSFDYYGEADGLLITRSGSSEDGIDNQKIYNKDTGAVYGMIKSYLSPLGKKTIFQYKKNVLKNINKSLKVSHGPNRLITYGTNELAISDDGSLTTYKWTPTGWKTGSEKILSKYGADNELFSENVVFSQHGLFIKDHSTGKSTSGQLTFRKRKVLLENANDFWEKPITVYPKGVIGFSTMDNSLILSADDGIHIYKYVSKDNQWQQVGDVIKYQHNSTTASVTASTGHLAYVEFKTSPNLPMTPNPSVGWNDSAFVTVIDVDTKGNYIKKYPSVNAGVTTNNYSNGFVPGVGENIGEAGVLKYNTDKNTFGRSAGVRIYAYKNMFYVNYPLAVAVFNQNPTIMYPIKGNRIVGLRFNSDGSGLQVDKSTQSWSNAFNSKQLIIGGNRCAEVLDPGKWSKSWFWLASSSITDWGLNHSSTVICYMSAEPKSVALGVCDFNGTKVYSGPAKHEGLTGCAAGSLSGTGLPSSKVAKSQNGVGNSVFYHFNPKIQKWEDVGNEPTGSFSEPVTDTNKTGNILTIISTVFAAIMMVVAIIAIPFSGGTSAALLVLIPLVISIGLSVAISYFPDTIKDVNSLDPAGTSLSQRYINDNRTLWFIDHYGKFSPLGTDSEHNVSVLKGLDGELISLSPSVGAGFVPFTAKDGKSGKWTSYIRILRNGELGKYVPVLSYASNGDKPYVMWDKKDAFAASTNGFFISYQQNSNKNFLKSTGDIYIHKALQDSATGSMNDYAISSVIVDDGASLHTTDYEYNTNNSAHTQSTIYGDVTIYPGGKNSKNGSLKHYYYTGDESIPSAGMLTGKKYKSEVYQYGINDPIASTQMKYLVDYTDEKLSINISQATQQVDGVESVTDYSYHPESRQLVKKVQTRITYDLKSLIGLVPESGDTKLQKQDISEYVYVWEKDDTVKQANYYSLVESVKSYSLINGQSLAMPAKYSFHIYEDWNNGLQGDKTYAKKCDYYSTANTNQTNPDKSGECSFPSLKLPIDLQWKEANVVLSRNPNGSVIQSKDARTDTYSTVRYTKYNDNYYPLAHFSNENDVSDTSGKTHGLNLYFGAELYENTSQTGLKLLKVVADQGDAFSGKSSLLFQGSGSISYTYQPQTKQPAVISFWLKVVQDKGNCQFVSDQTQTITPPKTNKWQYIHYVSNSSTVSFNLSCPAGSRIDEIAIHPVNGLFGANSYDFTNLLVTDTLANNGRNTHHKYNNFLRKKTSYENSNGDDNSVLLSSDSMVGWSRWGGSGIPDKTSGANTLFKQKTPNTATSITLSNHKYAQYIPYRDGVFPTIGNISNSFYFKLFVNYLTQIREGDLISIGGDKIKLSFTDRAGEITLSTSSGISKTYKITTDQIESISLAYVENTLFLWVADKLLGSFKNTIELSDEDSITGKISHNGILFAKNPQLSSFYRDALGRVMQQHVLSEVNGNIRDVMSANIYDGWGNVAVKTKVATPNDIVNSKCANYSDEMALLAYCPDLINAIDWSKITTHGIDGALKNYWDNQKEFTPFDKNTDGSFAFSYKLYTPSPLDRIKSASNNYGKLFSVGGKLGVNNTSYNDDEARKYMDNLFVNSTSGLIPNKHAHSFNDTTTSEAITIKDTGSNLSFINHTPSDFIQNMISANNTVFGLANNSSGAELESLSYSPKSFVSKAMPINPVPDKNTVKIQINRSLVSTNSYSKSVNMVYFSAVDPSTKKEICFSVKPSQIGDEKTLITPDEECPKASDVPNNVAEWDKMPLSKKTFFYSASPLTDSRIHFTFPVASNIKKFVVKLDNKGSTTKNDIDLFTTGKDSLYLENYNTPLAGRKCLLYEWKTKQTNYGFCPATQINKKFDSQNITNKNLKISINEDTEQLYLVKINRDLMNTNLYSTENKLVYLSVKINGKKVCLIANDFNLYTDKFPLNLVGRLDVAHNCPTAAKVPTSQFAYDMDFIESRDLKYSENYFFSLSDTVAKYKYPKYRLFQLHYNNATGSDIYETAILNKNSYLSELGTVQGSLEPSDLPTPPIRSSDPAYAKSKGDFFVIDNGKLPEECLLYSISKNSFSIDLCSKGLPNVINNSFVNKLKTYNAGRVSSFQETDSIGEKVTFKDSLGRTRFVCNNYIATDKSNGCSYSRYDYKGRVTEFGVLKNESGDMNYYLNKTDDLTYPTEVQSCPISYRFYDFAFDLEEAYDRENHTFNPVALSNKNISGKLFAIAKVNASVPEKPTIDCGTTKQDISVNYYWNKGNQWDGTNVYGSAITAVPLDDTNYFNYRNTYYETQLQAKKTAYPNINTAQFEINKQQKRVLYLYDTSHRLETICEGSPANFECDENKKYTDKYEYYVNGLLKSHLINNGKMKQSYSYDTLFRLKTIATISMADGSYIFKEDLAYEENESTPSGKGYQNGNIISITHSGSGLKAFGKNLEHRYEYTYDILDRLIKAEKFDLNKTLLQTFNYQYDFNGNMMKRSVSVPNKTTNVYDYSYKDNTNRLIEIKNINTRNESVKYDYKDVSNTIGAISNITRLLPDGSQKDIVFEREARSGKVLQLKVNDGKTTSNITYVYDSSGRRIKQQTSTAGAGRNKKQ